MHQMKIGHPDYCSPSVITVHQSDCMLHDSDEDGLPVVRFDQTDNLPTWEARITALERGLARARYELAKIFQAEGNEVEASRLFGLVADWKEAQCLVSTSTPQTPADAQTPQDYRDSASPGSV